MKILNHIGELGCFNRKKAL